MFAETRANSCSFLARREPEQPFCYWWGPTNTHRSWERGSGQLPWGTDTDSLHGSLPEFLPDVPDKREDAADYLGEGMAFDRGLGVRLERLRDLGELDNALVVVSGDHGIPGMPRGNCNLYDAGCEVALAARMPGRIPANRVVTDRVNLMYLAPTFLDIADVEIPETMGARSLLPTLDRQPSGTIENERDFVLTGRARHVADARPGNVPYPQRAIPTRQCLYIRDYAPERWPMGDPEGLDDPAAPAPDFHEVATNP